ncbi:MAG: exonuclease subunit SbcD [Peptostreptococcus porci]|nr:exonuclease subunit SbcD [Peptostreptococcus porci]
MRIIHTSDWHLGKNLEGRSRIDEQKKFCDDFVKIVNEENADIVVIAGDIYDTSNPPAIAERLFYDTAIRLSENGRRCVFVIAGNHDNPERLEAINGMALANGIIILGYPDSKAMISSFAGFEVIEAKSGFTKLRINDDKNSVVNILSLPYPSEKRLNESFENFDDEHKLQKTYSQKVGEFFSKRERYYNDEEINIAVSHIFVVGSEVSDSERRIELGGTLLVGKNDLPQKSQYTALGHIHKPQTASKSLNAYYSGSPIQYSKGERNTVKSVRIIDLEVGKEPKIRERYIDNYKRIEVFECGDVQNALEVCEKNSGQDIFAYFEIITDDVIDQNSIREMKKLIKDIVEIKPIVRDSEEFLAEEIVEINKSNISQYFSDFYKEQNSGLEPSEDVMKLFKTIVSSDMEEFEDEAD